jgi:hypothetical protein
MEGVCVCIGVCVATHLSPLAASSSALIPLECTALSPLLISWLTTCPVASSRTETVLSKSSTTAKVQAASKTMSLTREPGWAGMVTIGFPVATSHTQMLRLDEPGKWGGEEEWGRRRGKGG